MPPPALMNAALKYVVGMPDWPGGDPEQLSALSRFFLQIGDEFLNQLRAGDAAAGHVVSNNVGDAVDEFQAWWTRSGKDFLTTANENAWNKAAGLKAMAVETKIQHAIWLALLAFMLYMLATGVGALAARGVGAGALMAMPKSVITQQATRRSTNLSLVPPGPQRSGGGGLLALLIGAAAVGGIYWLLTQPGMPLGSSGDPAPTPAATPGIARPADTETGFERGEHKQVPRYFAKLDTDDQGRVTGVVADVRDGVLFLRIDVGNAPKQKGSGRKLFEEAILGIDGLDGVDAIRGRWKAIRGLSDNLDTFNNMRKAGKTEEEAAFETFTGKMAKEHGFTEAEIRSVRLGKDGSYIDVEVDFRRPGQ
jgi:hypothetical protein